MVFPEPEYAQNIVVGVRFRGNFAWYITEKEYWYLDYTKYHRALVASGHARLIVSDTFAGRFHIAVLDEQTAERFLSSIADKRVLASTLSHMMMARRTHEEQDDLLDFAPCLLVDFDQRQFSSQYPEMIRFERYIPDGWTGTYRNFLLEVPEKERYWIVGGKNLYTDDKNAGSSEC